MCRMGTEPSRTWQSWVVPLVAGFVLATSAVALLVPPAANSLTWRALAFHSAGLLALAATVVVVGVLGMHRLFKQHLGSRPSTAVLACAWSTAIWLPLMLLLQTEHALWLVAAPLPMTVIVTRFAKRRVLDDADAFEEEPDTDDALFVSMARLRRGRMAGLALVGGVLLQGLIAAAAFKLYTWAESLFILLTAILVWGFSAQTAVTPDGLRSERIWRRSSVLPCFLLTCLALTPFLRTALASVALRNVVLAGAVRGVTPPRVIYNNAYTGAILTTLPQHKDRIEAPAPVHASTTFSLRKPKEIPFDGVYWFYQWPDHQPGKDAPSKQGDPTVHFVSANNSSPLYMEAHQRLSNTLRTDCCSALRVNVKNMDNRIGVIGVEVILRDANSPGQSTRSLGTVPIRSSQLQKISLNRQPVEESLRFRMRGGTAFRFNQIDLIFHYGRDRNLASARVKVKGFVLEP
jgi:hypothetical protein